MLQWLGSFDFEAMEFTTEGQVFNFPRDHHCDVSASRVNPAWSVMPTHHLTTYVICVTLVSQHAILVYTNCHCNCWGRLAWYVPPRHIDTFQSFALTSEITMCACSMRVCFHKAHVVMRVLLPLPLPRSPPLHCRSLIAMWKAYSGLMM